MSASRMKFTFLLVNPDGESVNVTDTLELALVASSPKGPIFRRDDFARFSRSLTRSANSLHSVLTRICLVLFELNFKFKMLEYFGSRITWMGTALWPGSWYSISFNEKFTSAARIWFLFWPSRAHRKLNGGKAYTHRFAMNFFANSIRTAPTPKRRSW